MSERQKPTPERLKTSFEKILERTIDNAVEAFYVELQERLHDRNLMSSHRLLTPPERAQKALRIWESLYEIPELSGYFSEQRIKIADSRSAFRRDHNRGFIVFANGTGINIATDSEFEGRQGHGIPLTNDILSKRYSVNSNDRIIEAMMSQSPSHIKARILSLKFLNKLALN